MALTKKSLNNFLPNGFETQNKEGYKANFTNDRILSGYEKDTLEILSGPNLNNFIDKTGKNFNTLNDLLEYFNAMPIDSFPIVNASNQLDYKSINSFFRNVGELVFSSVPIDDKNLHLADGSLLDGKGTYRVFVDFIGKMATKYPNLFTDEANWQATVSKYGTCGKYVWNAENKTLRLPRLKGIIEATIDQNSIGNITEAGLPNITGTAQFSQEWETWGKYGYTGAFYLQKRGGNGVDGDRGNFDIVGFDASRSSQVYGKSNTVQPQTVKQYIYIVVSVDTEETTKLTSVFQYRGSVPTFDELPKEGNITGDVWNVDDTDVNYVWDGAEWDQLSGAVDLTGYYTKEQADTRFATVTSLESNVENLQSKITQNTTDIGSLGLGGLVASSLEKGKALKYLETKGNITEDADVYNDVYNYKHSTFDLSKFTAVGTPTITSDGVASGFSRGNYVQTLTSLPTSKDFTLKIKGHLNELPSGYVIGGTYNPNNDIVPLVIEFGTDANNQRVTLYVDDNGTNKLVSLWLKTPIYSVGDDFYIEVYRDKALNVYGARFYRNGIFVEELTKTEELDLAFETNLVFGIYKTNYAGIPFKGTIDLKQFSIEVDGKEVFNGNKTGLDVIKEDNFEVFGNPVISEDGWVNSIKSSTQSSIYKQGLDFTKASIVKFRGKIKLTEVVTYDNGRLFTFDDATKTRMMIKNLTNTKLIMFHTTDASSTTIEVIKDFNWILNQTYIIEFLIKPSELILKILDKNEEMITSVSRNIEKSVFENLLNQISNKKLYIGNGVTGEDRRLQGLIDLNSFKIYVDDQLVYQPCLKIPYNISKTGLKVANADARERVIGMGEDYGYSQYFTIDEENKNATLPIGAGITGRQDLIASFDDGTNKYEQFSDLTFKQSGKCTANTAVTFIQPYKDDTYKLSVPYSAKTKTGFTPTVSGDWFAEGKIYLD